jgi:hypothetical protein
VGSSFSCRDLGARALPSLRAAVLRQRLAMRPPPRVALETSGRVRVRLRTLPIDGLSSASLEDGTNSGAGVGVAFAGGGAVGGGSELSCDDVSHLRILRIFFPG